MPRCKINNQNYASFFFCCKCVIHKSEIVFRKRDAEERTIQQLKSDYEKLQTLLATASTAAAISKAHQECHSSKYPPMSEEIEIQNVNPGVLHVIAGSLNYVLDWDRKTDREK